MTNTHINIGGHKVTTNKVGQVHTVSSADLGANITVNSGGSIVWQVVNNVCYMTIYNVQCSATGGNVLIKQNIPKATGKRNVMALTDGVGTLRATCTMGVDATSISVGVGTANVPFFGSFIYPVADDWVES